jgi:hypothetical protein
MTLASEVGFAGTTTTHLLKGEWTYHGDNRTACGLEATAVGYYQFGGKSEVTCLTCVGISTRKSQR